MAHLRPQFEKELLNRVKLKSTSHISEEQVLIRAFRYYDLNNTSTVTRDQFLQVVDKLGMQVLAKEEIYDLFNYYAENNQLNYKKFIQLLYSNMTASSRRFSPLKNQPYSYSYSKPLQPQDYIFKLQRKISEGQPDILLQIIQAFMDRSDQEIKLEEFEAVIALFAPGTTPDEIKKIFNYFDKRLSNRINYNDVIMTLRGIISYQIQEAMAKIFSQLTRGNNYLDLDILLDNFNEKAFNTKGYSQLERLKDNLRIYLQYRQIENRQFTQKQFEEFNYLANYTIQNDAQFINLMQQVWLSLGNFSNQNSYQKLYNHSNQSNYQQNVSNTTPIKKLIFNDDSTNKKQESQTSPTETLRKLRILLTKRGPKSFINFHRQMRIMDDDIDKQLTFDQFRRVFIDYKIDLNENEITDIFRYLDDQNTGKLKIEQAMLEILGPIDIDCRETTERVFDGIDKDCDGIILLQELKSIFTPKYHPDAKQGKKSETEILAEFLDSYEAHHTLYVGMRDPRVCKKEFMDYYHIVYASIDNLAQYQNVLKGCYFQILNTPPRNGYIQFQPQRQEENQSYVMANAPFGTSNVKMDYGTSLRPVSTEKYNNNSSSSKKRNQYQQQGSKNVPAGLPSWPGFLLTFDQKPSGGGRDTILQIQQKFKQRGLRGVLQMLKSLLKQVDQNATILKNGQFALNAKQIYSCFQEIRIPLDQEQQIIYFQLELEDSMTLSYVLLNLIGPLSEYRKNLIQEAFQMRLGGRQITPNDLKNRFFPNNHPDVIRQLKSEDEVLVEFMDTFDQHHKIYSDNNVVTVSEFEHYYWLISFLVEDDRQFEQVFKSYQLRKQL